MSSVLLSFSLSMLAVVQLSFAVFLYVSLHRVQCFQFISLPKLMPSLFVLTLCALRDNST